MKQIRSLVVTIILVITFPLAALAQSSDTPEPDSPETLREMEMSLEAEQDIHIPDSTLFDTNPAIPLAVQYPLFVGVDNVNVPAYRIDPPTNNMLEAFIGAQVWGAAYDPLNDIVYFNNGALLYEWPVGGSINLLGTIVDSLGVTQSMVGLAFFNNTLYGTKNIANEAVYIINPATLVAVVYIDYADADFDFGGLAADPTTGALYGTNDDATPFGTGLFRINLNGTATLVAPYPVGQTDIDGLAISHDRKAYLVTDEPGVIYVYDLVTGNYLTPINNPWTSAEVFSGATWLYDQSPSLCNPFSVAIPAIGTSGEALPYPSVIQVEGYTSLITKVRVHLLGLAHGWPDDIDILLVGPQGQNLILMSDTGGSNAITNINLTFDDAAASQLPDSTVITPGVYRPTNYGLGDSFPAPSPAPSSATQLATFNNTDPNGNWKLFVVDDSGGDAGSIALGWCLEIEVQQPTGNVTPNAISQQQPPNRQLTRPLTVSNTGPALLTWATGEAAVTNIMMSADNLQPGPSFTVDPELEWGELIDGLPQGQSVHDASSISLDAFVSAASSSGLIFYGNRATFETVFPGLPVEDFEAGLWNDNNTLGCPAPFNAFTNNACFAPGGILPGVSFQDNPLNSAGGGSANGLAGVGAGALGAVSKNIVTNTAADSFEIIFSPAVNAVGMDLIHFFTNGVIEQVALYDSADSLITITEAIANNTGNFWGVYSAVPIRRINIRSAGGFEGVDNVAFGQVGNCSPPVDLPWVSVNPSTGMLAGGASVDLNVNFDSTGLSLGEYTGNLCLYSNDPMQPLIEVPINLTVTYTVHLPLIQKPTAP